MKEEVQEIYNPKRKLIKKMKKFKNKVFNKINLCKLKILRQKLLKNLIKIA